MTGSGDAGREPPTAGIDVFTAAVRVGPDPAVVDWSAASPHRHPVPPETVFPAGSSRLAPVRGAPHTWPDQRRLPPHTMRNGPVAAGEACAGATGHGHRHNPGEPVRLRSEALVDDLRPTVADTCRGRDMAPMRAVTQQVTVVPGPSGPTVDIDTRTA